MVTASDTRVHRGSHADGAFTEERRHVIPVRERVGPQRSRTGLDH